jgi:hypothetical protein
MSELSEEEQTLERLVLISTAIHNVIKLESESSGSEQRVSNCDAVEGKKMLFLV